MKKLFTTLIVLMLVAMLAGCSNAPTHTVAQPTTSQIEQPDEEDISPVFLGTETARKEYKRALSLYQYDTVTQVLQTYIQANPGESEKEAQALKLARSATQKMDGLGVLPNEYGGAGGIYPLSSTGSISPLILNAETFGLNFSVRLDDWIFFDTITVNRNGDPPLIFRFDFNDVRRDVTADGQIVEAAFVTCVTDSQFEELESMLALAHPTLHFTGDGIYDYEITPQDIKLIKQMAALFKENRLLWSFL